MKVIKQTNGDASTRYNAKVKTIESIRIGKDAVESTGRILLPPQLPSEDDELADNGGGEFDEGYGRDEGLGAGAGSQYLDPNAVSGDEGEGSDRYGEEGGFGGDDSEDPAEGRYVDRDYRPLSAQKLRDVLASTETMEPEDAYLAVAKRIPVRVRLSIDQRYLCLLYTSPSPRDRG